jgi:hypothetical protein
MPFRCLLCRLYEVTLQIRFSWVVVLPRSMRVLSRILLRHDFRYDLSVQPALAERGIVRMISFKGTHCSDVLAWPDQLETGLPLHHAAARD